MTEPRSTQHFPLQVVQNVFHAPVGAVHGGVGDQVIGSLEASIGKVQGQGDSAIAEAILTLASVLQQADDFSETQRAEATETVEVIAAEAAKPVDDRKLNFVRVTLNALVATAKGSKHVAKIAEAVESLQSLFQ